MRALAENFEYLADRVKRMASASLVEISKAIDDLFGERVGKEQRQVLATRYDRRSGSGPSHVLSEPRTGSIYAPAVVVAPERLRGVPRHNFHPFILENKDDE